MADKVRKVMENQFWLVLEVLVRICVFTLNKIRCHCRTDLHFKSTSLIVYLTKGGGRRGSKKASKKERR